MFIIYCQLTRADRNSGAKSRQSERTCLTACVCWLHFACVFTQPDGYFLPYFITLSFFPFVFLLLWFMTSSCYPHPEGLPLFVLRVIDKELSECDTIQMSQRAAAICLISKWVVSKPEVNGVYWVRPVDAVGQRWRKRSTFNHRRETPRGETDTLGLHWSSKCGCSGLTIHHCSWWKVITLREADSTSTMFLFLCVQRSNKDSQPHSQRGGTQPCSLACNKKKTSICARRLATTNLQKGSMCWSRSNHNATLNNSLLSLTNGASVR